LLTLMPTSRKEHQHRDPPKRSRRRERKRADLSEVLDVVPRMERWLTQILADLELWGRIQRALIERTLPIRMDDYLEGHQLPDRLEGITAKVRDVLRRIGAADENELARRYEAGALHEMAAAALERVKQWDDVLVRGGRELLRAALQRTKAAEDWDLLIFEGKTPAEARAILSKRLGVDESTLRKWGDPATWALPDARLLARFDDLEDHMND
jgi:hypothetical protein